MEKRSEISITVEEVPGGCSNNLFVSGDCNENVMSGDDVAISWKCGNCTGDPSGKLKIKLKFLFLFLFTFITFYWVINSVSNSIHISFLVDQKKKFTEWKHVLGAKDAYPFATKNKPVFARTLNILT